MLEILKPMHWVFFQHFPVIEQNTDCQGWRQIEAELDAEVGGTKFWVLESESGIMPKPKRIRYWIRDSEKKLNETKSETETRKKP